jgi:hypothetical protein
MPPRSTFELIAAEIQALQPTSTEYASMVRCSDMSLGKPQQVVMNCRRNLVVKLKIPLRRRGCSLFSLKRVG